MCFVVSLSFCGICSNDLFFATETRAISFFKASEELPLGTTPSTMANKDSGISRKPDDRRIARSGRILRSFVATVPPSIPGMW